MTGGSLIVPTPLVIGYGTARFATFTVNGSAVVVSASSTSVNSGINGNGGSATINLQDGDYQTDFIANYTTALNSYAFNLSGGTLQPRDGNILSFGTATAANNFFFTISGLAATISSNDGSGIARTVPIYANFAGSGAVNFGGGGMVVMLGKSSTFNGVYSVNSGVMQIGNSNALASGNVTVNGGILDINGLAPSTGTVTLVSGSINDSVGFGQLNASAYALQSGTANVSLGGATAPLVKTTSGLARLNGANTYGGPTTVVAGTLLLGATASLGTGNVTVNPGALLDVSALGPFGFNVSNMTLTAGRTSSFATDINGSVNMSSATIAPTPNGTMTIAGNLSLNGNVTYSYATGDRIAVNGALSLSNPTYLLPTGALSSGTHTLMTYTSGSPDPIDLGMGGSYGVGTRQTFTFGTSGGSAVTLTVTGNPATLQWNTANGTWNLNSAASWYNTTTGSADVFYNGDTVIFNDRPGGSSASVNVSGSVSPSSLTVSNTNVSYTINGAGSIDGITSLVVNGPGAISINNANTYSGGTFLNAGRLNVGNPAALGSGALTINGGSLDNSSGSAMTLYSNNQTWNAGFTFVGGNPLNLGSGTVTLNVTPTVTVSSSTLTIGGPVVGNYGLTVAGPGTLSLAGSNTYTGNTTISSGVLQMGFIGALPNGPGAGNVVFGSAATSAVLDLNGNDTTINGLSQPSLSTANRVVDNAPFSSNILYVGNNDASSTFGGVLADNNGSGGQLSLEKIGAGTLTLLGSNTYTGPTTIDNGTLQLGDGAAGHDGSINQSSGITVNGVLAYYHFAPLAISQYITGSGTLALFGSTPVTFSNNPSFGVLGIGGNGPIGGSAITLTSSDGLAFGYDIVLNNSATGTTILTAPINISNGMADFAGGSGGTLDIESAITQSTGNFFLDTGNFTMGNSGSITVGGAGGGMGLVNNHSGATPPGVLNFLQTGGLINVVRPGKIGLYMSQGGTGSYTITGGSAVIVGALAAGYGPGCYGSMTINGPGALVTATSTNMNSASVGNGGNGTINLLNGTLQTDILFTNNAAAGAYNFNFSGGLLQSLGSGAISFGTSSAATNIAITLIGTGATISSTDGGGNPQTVPIYATLTGSGAVNLTGAGTLVLLSSGNNYSGGTHVNGGTVQLGADAGLGTGALSINSGVVDLGGFNPSIGGLSGAPGTTVANLSGTSKSTLTVAGTGSDVFAGTIADGPTNTTGLVVSGGQLTLSGTNTFTGGTTVTACTLIATNSQALADGSSLTVGNALAFTPAPVVPAASAGVAAVPEPGTLLLLSAALSAAAMLSRSRRRAKTVN